MQLIESWWIWRRRLRSSNISYMKHSQLLRDYPQKNLRKKKKNSKGSWNCSLSLLTLWVYYRGKDYPVFNVQSVLGAQNVPKWHGINDTECNIIYDTEFVAYSWHGINDTTLYLTWNSDKMARDSRHGIKILWKFSKKSLHWGLWGEKIKLSKNPCMGTLRGHIRRCSCKGDNFFWKLLPKTLGVRFLHNKIVLGILEIFFVLRIFFGK